MELKEALDIVSYKIGLRFGETVLGDELFLDKKIHEAILDKAAGSEREIDLKVYMQATHMVSAERTRLFQVKNETFLTDNASNSDVKTTESGLQYKVLQSADTSAAKPTLTDTVTVHYTGKLTCGTTFDSSVERGEPATFAVDKVIAGWTEALQLMQVGEKFQLFIPQGLGYGKRGMGGDIPPYATLVFDVELLAIS
ncbi:MAG: FKBP-type peptidyl-prolyl cis-trans isomerase FklB [Cryomorphaceae bacterium]|jgi:FKBP-type peptidyl-prolyl cis-trans isomerase FklB